MHRTTENEYPEFVADTEVTVSIEKPILVTKVKRSSRDSTKVSMMLNGRSHRGLYEKVCKIEPCPDMTVCLLMMGGSREHPHPKKVFYHNGKLRTTSAQFPVYGSDGKLLVCGGDFCPSDLAGNHVILTVRVRLDYRLSGIFVPTMVQIVDPRVV
jgi:hypothetical protein